MSRNWTCPAGEIWDRYVADPDLPGREELARHLEGCPDCRLLVADRTRQADELAAQWSAKVMPRIIVLSVLPEPAGMAAEATVMAAQGDESEKSPESLTLASPGQEIVLRAVRYRHTNDVWLYLIADDPEHFSRVIVKPFGEDHEYVTDEGGRINLGRMDWPTPELLTAEVHLPHALFKLTPLEHLSEASSSVVLDSAAGDQIQVVLYGEGRHRRLEVNVLHLSDTQTESSWKVAIRSEGKLGILQVQPVVADRASFEQVETAEPLEIYLYQ